MPLTQETFAAVVLEDIDGHWELYEGKLREKPEMSAGHNVATWKLLQQLMPRLDQSRYQLRLNASHLRVPGGNTFIPDLAVVPTRLFNAFQPDLRQFEAYDEPLPLVVEIWSPSTGTYDIDRKLPGYRARGDAEIWRVHPFERNVTVWRRQPDGGYVETQHTGGTLRLAALPDVTIDLETFFNMD